MKNPFNIPDLTPMHNTVWEFIKANQGEKGFILTDRPECDRINVLFYDYDYFLWNEYQIKAIRAVDNYKIEILFDPYNTRYSEESVKELEDSWRDLQDDGDFYYIPAIFEIAENIEEYV